MFKKRKETPPHTHTHNTTQANLHKSALDRLHISANVQQAAHFVADGNVVAGALGEAVDALVLPTKAHQILHLGSIGAPLDEGAQELTALREALGKRVTVRNKNVALCYFMQCFACKAAVVHTP